MISSYLVMHSIYSIWAGTDLCYPLLSNLCFFKSHSMYHLRHGRAPERLKSRTGINVYLRLTLSVSMACYFITGYIEKYTFVYVENCHFSVTNSDMFNLKGTLMRIKHHLFLWEIEIYSGTYVLNEVTRGKTSLIPIVYFILLRFLWTPNCRNLEVFILPCWFTLI